MTICFTIGSILYIIFLIFISDIDVDGKIKFSFTRFIYLIQSVLNIENKNKNKNYDDVNMQARSNCIIR